MSATLWKRILCLTLCAVLTVGMLPPAVYEVTHAAQGDHAYTVCGGSCTHEETHETVSFQRWTGVVHYC